APHVGGGPVERQQVVLEQLDALEACVGDGFQLAREGAARADRGDGCLHFGPPVEEAASRAAQAVSKVRFMRATSGTSPVKWRKASTAWCTHMPPPLMVRQPFFRAAS